LSNLDHAASPEVEEQAGYTAPTGEAFQDRAAFDVWVDSVAGEPRVSQSTRRAAPVIPATHAAVKDRLGASGFQFGHLPRLESRRFPTWPHVQFRHEASSVEPAPGDP
jgi:hypothetical protein